MSKSPIAAIVFTVAACGAATVVRGEDLGATPQPASVHSQIVATCSARPPEPGQAFSGPVLEVLDGRTICVAQGPTPREWIQVTLNGRETDGMRGPLMAASFARTVTCVAGPPSEQGVVADCWIDGVALGAATRTPAALTEGRVWR